MAQGTSEEAITKVCLMVFAMSIFTLVDPSFGYKILVIPFAAGFNSRMMNMQKMADILAQDGHQVSVVMNNRVKDHIFTKYADIINFKVAENIKDVSGFSIKEWNMKGIAFVALMDRITEVSLSFCECLLQDNTIMNALRDGGYDLIITDLFDECGNVISSHLNVTTIYYQNFGFFPMSHAFFPLMTSFTCQALGITCIRDDMTFLERILNTLFVITYNNYILPKNRDRFIKLAHESGVELKSPMETINQDKIMLVNVDYALDTPRPTMPHVFTVSGLYHKVPLPLTAEFQDIINKAGPHGVILMSFGTLVPRFDTQTAEKFSNVFGKLKQHIIWRFVGNKPKNLKDNTHLVEWFPQNDLLANPAIKLFITHCGISSTFESAYNGVPIVAMPLFADQIYNTKKLTEKVGMGIELDYNSFGEEDLENVIHEVLSNPQYKENAKRASLVMSDQLVPPVQKFRHLVNFTIKSGGAKHLFHPYAVRMSWFTFYGLDVITFMITIIAVVLITIFLSFRQMYKCCFSKKNSMKVKKQ